MKISRPLHALGALLLLAAAAEAQIARGTGVNLPLVGRLVGGGNTLFRTAIDVANHTGAAARVDFYFDGQDLATQQAISAVGSVTNSGLFAQGAGTLQGSSNASFGDFIQSLVDAGRITAETRDHGVLGSVLFVFDGVEQRGGGAASARFYNDFGGGTVSVALAGREITRDEPIVLRGIVRDTRGKTGPQLYSNLFINHTGVAPIDGRASEDVAVTIAGISAATGLSVGNEITLTIPKGQTRSVNQVLTALGVSPAGDDTLIVTVRRTSGGAAIAGIISTVDATTRDGSVVEMTPAEF